MKDNILAGLVPRYNNCPDDLIIWPCGTQCFRSEVAEHTHMSDDYEVVSFGSVRYNQLVNS